MWPVISPLRRLMRAARSCYAFVSSLSRTTRSCSSLDAIFELAPIVRELLGHRIGPARHIATDCRPDVHGLTNLEFMRGHRTSHVWPAHRAVALTRLAARRRYMSS